MINAAPFKDIMNLIVRLKYSKVQLHFSADGRLQLSGEAIYLSRRELFALSYVTPQMWESVHVEKM
jgi:hypothetical protein